MTLNIIILFLVNGYYKSSDFKFEEKEKVKIEKH